MNRTSRISVVVIIGLICICISVSIFFMMGSTAVMDMLISDKPGSARRVGNSILDYTLPSGYQEQGSLNLGVFKVVYIALMDSEAQYDASKQIMLIHVPSALALRQEEARQEIQLAILRSSSEVSTMGYVGEQFAAIPDTIERFRLCFLVSEVIRPAIRLLHPVADNPKPGAARRLWPGFNNHLLLPEVFQESAGFPAYPGQDCRGHDATRFGQRLQPARRNRRSGRTPAKCDFVLSFQRRR